MRGERWVDRGDVRRGRWVDKDGVRERLRVMWRGVGG